MTSLPYGGGGLQNMTYYDKGGGSWDNEDNSRLHLYNLNKI